MDAFVSTLLTLIVPSVPVLLMVYFIINPEKFETWVSILYKALAQLRLFRSRTQKRYVKYDLQGRINGFVKRVSKSAPYLEESGISVEWVDTNQDKKAFLENGKVVLRLRKDDPEDLNFVHGAYWAVSAKLLPRVKTYVAPYQRQALDLYVTSKIIEKEKYSVIQQFLDHYLHPYLSDGNDNIKALYDKFAAIDTYGAFYPILLQELYFLSLKVFGKPQSQQIILEVSNLVNHLHDVALRQANQEIRLDFDGAYCRFAIVIVGKGEKIALQGTNPYVEFVRRSVVPSKKETVYLLGKADNREFIDEVVAELQDNFEIYRTHQFKGVLRIRNGNEREQNTYLVVLRARNISLYQGG